MNDLNILIKAKLDEVASTANIDEQIKKISQKLSAINLEIKINDNVLKTLQDFSQSIKNMQSVIDEQNKIVQTNIEITKEQDGTIKTVQTDLLKSGEIIQKTTTEINKQNEALNQNRDSLNQESKAIQENINLTNDLIKVKQKYNSEQQLQSTTNTYKNGSITTTQTILPNSNLPSSQTTIIDLQKLQDELMSVGEISDSIIDKESVKYQELIGIYEQLNAELEKYKTGQESVSQTEIANIQQRVDKLKSEYEQLAQNEQEQIRLANLGTKQNIAYTGYSNDDLKQYVSNLYGATAQITKFYGEQKTANGIVNSAKVAIQQLNGTYKEFTVTVDSASQGVYQSAEVIKNAAGKDMDLVGQLKVALERFPVWIVASTAVMGLIHQVQTGIQILNDLNKAQTNIQMITGATTEQTAQWTKSLSNLSSQLHDTTMNVMSASEEFLRAGNNIQETQQLIEASTVMSKISGQTQADVAQELIAIQNAFNMSAQDMMSVVDKLTTVDNNSATSTAELGQALERTAASAQNAGVTFDELVSYVATVSSVTRKSAESIGESFKTIFARLQSLKQGVNYDEEGQPLSNVEASLNKVGIALRDSQYQFKNMDEVLNEVAQKWSSLNDVQKADVAEQIAGTRQRENFLVLMDHYNEALKLQQEMTDSSGSALKRYQDYSQSTEARLNDLTNAVQRFWMSAVNSSDINSAIDMITRFVNTLTSLVNHVGAIPVTFAVATPALLAFDKTLYSLISKNIISFFIGLKDSILGISSATAEASAGVKGLTLSLESLRAIGTGLFEMLFPMAIIMGVGYLIGFVIDKINQARQAQAELDKQNKQMASDYQANSTKIDTLVAEYDLLKNKTSLSVEEQQRLVDVQNELNKLMPSLTAKVDEQGNAHLKNTDTIKKEIEYAQQLAQIENQKKVANVTNDLSSTFNNIDKYKKQLEDLKTTAELYKNSYNYDIKQTKDSTLAQENLKLYLETEQKIVEVQNQLNDAISRVPSVLKTAASAYMQLVDTHHQLTQADQDYINSLINQNAASLKTTEQGKNFYDSLTRQIDGIIKVKDSLSNLSNDQLKNNNVIQQAIKTLESYGITASNANKIIQDTINYSKNLSNTAQSEISGLSMLNDAVNKLSNGYHLTQDEINKLVAKYPDLKNALTEENGLTNINIKALEDKQKAEADSANTTIKALEAEVQKQKEALAAKLPMYADEIKAIQSVADAQALAASMADKAMEQAYKNLNNLSNAGLIPDNRLKMMLNSPYYQNVAKQATSAVDEIGSLLSEINSLQSEVSKVGVSSTSPISPSSSGYFPSGSSSSGSKGSSGSTSTKTVEPYVIDEYSHQMAELDLQLQESKNRLDQLDKSSQDYTNELNAQNIIIQKEIDLTKNRINSLNASNDALLKQINALQQNKKLNADQQEQLNNLLKTYDDNRNSIEQLEGKIIDLNSALQQNITTVQQAWLDNAKNIASQVVDAYKAALQEEETLALKAKDDELKAEEQRHQTVMNSLDGELQKYQDVINAKLKLIDAESAQHDYEEQLADLQQQQSDIQKQINVLSLDDSVEAQAKLADLKQQYADTSKKIDDLRYKNETDLRKQNLQDQLDAYQKDIQAKKDAENQIYQANQDEINREKELIQAHYNDLLNDTQNFTNMQQQIIEGKGSEILNTLTNYINTFNSLMKDSINQNGEDLLGLLGLIQQLQSAQTGLSSLGSPPSISSNGLTVNSGNGTSQTKNAIAVLSPSQYQLDSTGSAIMPSRTLGSILGVGVEWDANTGMVKIGGKLFIPSKIDSSGTSYVPIRVVAAALGHQVEYSNGKISIFDTGGYTGEFSGGKLAILHEKELVLNKDDTANLLKTINFNNNFIKYLEGLQLPSLNTSNNNSNNVNVNVYIGKVTGDEEGAQTLITSFINGLKKKGLRLA